MGKKVSETKEISAPRQKPRRAWFVARHDLGANIHAPSGVVRVFEFRCGTMN